MDRTLKIFAQLAIVLLLIAAAVVAWQYRDSISPVNIQRVLADYPYAPLVFLGLHIVASLSIFVPRTVLALAAGMVFGLWLGICWAVLGAMLGAWVAFAIARGVGNRLLAYLPTGVASVIDRFKRGGWRAVWGIRLLPLPHSPINYAFGLTTVSWRDYSIGSFLGILPSTVLFVGLGAAGNQALNGENSSWILPSAIGIVAFALSLILPKLVSRTAER